MRITVSAKKGEVHRKWWVADLEGQTLGRAATKIASTLRGKTKAVFTPHEDAGDFVVVINAEKLRVTGAKLTDKFYRRHTGFPGGVREISAGKALNEKPELVIWHAVKGMLPKTAQGRRLLKKLKIYSGSQHPHAAQRPDAMTF